MAQNFDWTKPLYCQPRIAQVIGHDAGIVYERLKYMIKESGRKKQEFGCIHEDGRRWVDFSYAQLFEFMPIFKSVKALRDVIGKLEKAGFIESKPVYKGGSKWYTITDLDPETLTQDGTVEDDATGHGVRRAESGTMTPQVRDYDATGQGTLIYSNRIISESISESPDSSSSPPPDESPISPPIAKEKELENIIPLEIDSLVENPKSDHDQCIQSFARLCGFNINTSAAREITDKLGEGVADIRRTDKHLTARDFEYFRIYYDQLPPLPGGKKRPLCPAIKFVVTGWRGYCDWYNLWSEETEGRYLDGQGYVQRPRWQWYEIEAGTFSEAMREAV